MGRIHSGRGVVKQINPIIFLDFLPKFALAAPIFILYCTDFFYPFCYIFKLLHIDRNSSREQKPRDWVSKMSCFVGHFLIKKNKLALCRIFFLFPSFLTPDRTFLKPKIM